MNPTVSTVFLQKAIKKGRRLTYPVEGSEETPGDG